MLHQLRATRRSSLLTAPLLAARMAHWRLSEASTGGRQFGASWQPDMSVTSDGDYLYVCAPNKIGLLKVRQPTSPHTAIPESLTRAPPPCSGWH